MTDGIKKEGNEIGEVIRVIMGKEQVLNSMTIHRGFQEISQGPWAKVHQKGHIGFHQIASSGSTWMKVGPGPENRDAHGLSFSANEP